MFDIEPQHFLEELGFVRLHFHKSMQVERQAYSDGVLLAALALGSASCVIAVSATVGGCFCLVCCHILKFLRKDREKSLHNQRRRQKFLVVQSASQAKLTFFLFAKSKLFAIFAKTINIKANDTYMAQVEHSVKSALDKIASAMYYSDFEVTDDNRIIIKEKMPYTIISNIRNNIKDVDFVESAQHPLPE